ncbi:MAG: sigma-70 family RNA polymerase sigma factor [bacterium]|nr:sigma-70 family RNA polymerase sigma factor [bacterium]
MRKYTNNCMEELAGELCAGLKRLRRGYIDAAELMIRMIESDRTYPFEFIFFRLTGYRPPPGQVSAGVLQGKGLLSDLQSLMFDVCDSFELLTTDYDGFVYDTPSLARRFNISTKTVQRWRRRGMPSRRLIFPDGKRRVAFLESSVQWFTDNHLRDVSRSVRFTQMSPVERDDIIRRAKRMVTFTSCKLSDVSRRIARKTGRAAETIRYTIRNYDLKHSNNTIFATMPNPLGDREKASIYRSFLRGIPVPMLAEKYRRKRGSIYRIVNEMRAKQLLNRPINFIASEEFELPDADDLILGTKQGKKSIKTATSSRATKVPAGLPPYLQALYDVPLLGAEGERELFRRYNYLKYKADKLRSEIDIDHVRTQQLKEIETFLVRANVVKDRIIRSNLRLVVSIAKKHIGGAQTLFELISDGNVSLMRAVEKFDYSRGFRFSTYASWAIMRNYARSVPKERYQLDHFATGHDEVLNIAASLRTYDPNELNMSELRESIGVILAQLSSVERLIVTDHFGLDADVPPKTLESLGRELGISKERVRQIEIQAIRKLRDIMSLDGNEMLV